MLGRSPYESTDQALRAFLVRIATGLAPELCCKPNEGATASRLLDDHIIQGLPSVHGTRLTCLHLWVSVVDMPTMELWCCPSCLAAYEAARVVAAARTEALR